MEKGMPGERAFTDAFATWARDADFSAETSTMLNWRGQVVDLLARHKHYPTEAFSKGEEGTVLVNFTIDRSGHLIDSRIGQSSGSALLDHEVIDLLNRSQPFPPLPSDYSDGPRINLTIPIRFSLADGPQQPTPEISAAYKTVSLIDFKLDRETLKGAKVRVTGQLHQLGEIVTFGSTLFDMTPIFIDIKGLPREQRKTILERCNLGCDAVVKGRVDTVFMEEVGLIAEDVSIH